MFWSVEETSGCVPSTIGRAASREKAESFIASELGKLESTDGEDDKSFAFYIAYLTARTSPDGSSTAVASSSLQGENHEARLELGPAANGLGTWDFRG